MKALVNFDLFSYELELIDYVLSTVLLVFVLSLNAVSYELLSFDEEGNILAECYVSVEGQTARQLDKTLICFH
jgi:hypothetical protein